MCVTNIVDFAFPALSTFMRPDVSECVAPRFHHLLAVGILFHSVVILTALLDADVDSPATVRYMVQMLSRRVVAGLPTIESLFA